jgi:hypothetical protein
MGVLFPTCSSFVFQKSWFLRTVVEEDPTYALGAQCKPRFVNSIAEKPVLTRLRSLTSWRGTRDSTRVYGVSERFSQKGKHC